MAVVAGRRNHQHQRLRPRAHRRREHVVQPPVGRRVQLVVNHHRRIEPVLAVRLGRDRPVEAPARPMHDPLLRLDDVTRRRRARDRSGSSAPPRQTPARPGPCRPPPNTPRRPFRHRPAGHTSAIAAASSVLPFLRGSISRHVRYCRSPSGRFLNSCLRIRTCQGRRLNVWRRERPLGMGQAVDEGDRVSGGILRPQGAIVAGFGCSPVPATGLAGFRQDERRVSHWSVRHQPHVARHDGRRLVSPVTC